MSGLGPILGQAFHFRNDAPEKLPYAIDRYIKGAGRLCGVLDKQLAGRDFIAGDYSIADMACYSWTLVAERLGNQRSEEHTSELQSLMRISYAVFCLKKKKKNKQTSII